MPILTIRVKREPSVDIHDRFDVIGERIETDAEMVQRANVMLRNWMRKCEDRCKVLPFTPFIRSVESSGPRDHKSFVLHVTYEPMPLVEDRDEFIADDSFAGEELLTDEDKE